jgi:sugar diacid utilization regulator
MKENKKVWKTTNTATFVDINTIDYLLNNNMDITGLKAFKQYRKDEKE